MPAPIELITGVEINALARGIPLQDGELHILGFGMDLDDEAFEAALAAQRAARRVRFERTVARLREIGLPIDDQVAGLDPDDDDALGRPTIARALIAAGFATSVEDAFRRLIGWGGPAYVPREGMGPREAIEAIRDAGGLPVLAHFSEAPVADAAAPRADRDRPGRPRGLLPDVPARDRHDGRRGGRRRSDSSPPAAPTTTAT